MNCLKWATGLSNYLVQLAATHTLPLSFFLVFQVMLFFNETIHGKYDVTIRDFICFNHPAKDLRISKFIHFSPVKTCHQIKTQKFYFQRICGYSNYLSAINSSIFDKFNCFRRALLITVRDNLPKHNFPKPNLPNVKDNLLNFF